VQVTWCIPVHPGMKRGRTIFLAWVGPDSTKSVPGHVMPNLCFAFGGICGSYSAFWCIRAVKRRCTIFHARMGPIRITQKVHRDMLHQTCVFASGGICGVT
jgi:hypothetical protein